MYFLTAGFKTMCSFGASAASNKLAVGRQSDRRIAADLTILIDTFFEYGML
jgi:hypothetical protein